MLYQKAHSGWHSSLAGQTISYWHTSQAGRKVKAKKAPATQPKVNGTDPDSYRDHVIGLLLEALDRM